MNEFDPLSSYFEKNPYAELKRMRESCRAYRHEGTLMPVVSFFHNADIRPMLADWRTWSSQRSAEYNEKALGDMAMLIGNDPPLHTKYRELVAPLFLPSEMAKFEDSIQANSVAALDECLEKGEVNFVEDYAAKVTVALICDLVGVPASDRQLMREMTIDMALEDGRPVFWKQPNPEVEARVERVMSEMRTYFAAHIDEKIANPKDDILSKLAGSIEERRHLIGISMLMVAAGNETTTNLMAHGLQELLRHPEQMRMLKDAPDKHMDGFVEEILRYRGTIRKQDRIATIDTEIDGVQINKGDSIALWNASASRDPEVIADPETFDITRHPNRHLAFGSGIHMCIGNALARREMKIAMRYLLDNISSIELAKGDDSYESHKNGVLEAAKRFDVRLRAA